MDPFDGPEISQGASSSFYHHLRSFLSQCLLRPQPQQPPASLSSHPSTQNGTLPKARYFIRISLGKQELETTKAKPHESALEWATPVTLAIEDPESNGLILELWSIAKDSAVPFTKKSKPIVIANATIRWGETSLEGTKRELTLGDVVVSFDLRVSTMEKIVEKDLEDASQSAQAMKQLSFEEGVEVGSDIVGNLQPAFDAVQPFLEKFEAVMTLMDKLTKVHPYLNGAWVVLSAIPKVLDCLLTTIQSIIRRPFDEKLHGIEKLRGMKNSRHKRVILSNFDTDLGSTNNLKPRKLTSLVPSSRYTCV